MEVKDLERFLRSWLTSPKLQNPVSSPVSFLKTKPLRTSIDRANCFSKSLMSENRINSLAAELPPLAPGYPVGIVPQRSLEGSAIRPLSLTAWYADEDAYLKFSAIRS